MVQPLLPPDQDSPNPPTLKTNHVFLGIAKTACTNIFCAHSGEKNPLQVSFTRFDVVVEFPGDTYLDRNGSIWSSALIRGLLSEMRDNHSWVSTTKSSKSSLYPEISASSGGLSGGSFTLIPPVSSGETVTAVGKCLSNGSGDGACSPVSKIDQ
jgi:hypothetical protein